ncbi:hypothetical protein [Paenibacillus sp.]|jgi:uncharacterized phage infection (PIP) family protein YhgE|uniref:hypothetical protein n=1 Tax=Paenibacillus sp. TaxID=58172 RepID=UPI002816D2CE|nr:hypothetical protein [Paenibacillus sp.]MDR0268397.1 hypothetical protein [Paenibacillus sp.]
MNALKELASLIGAGVFTILVSIGFLFLVYTIFSFLGDFSFGRSVSIPGSFLLLVGLFGLYLCEKLNR